MKFQKISILPLQKELEFPRGEEFCKTKNLKKCMKLKLEFLGGCFFGGWESLMWERYGYFLAYTIN